MSLARAVRQVLLRDSRSRNASLAAVIGELSLALSASARSLTRHAALAPHERAARELQSLAEEDERAASLAASRLAAGQGPVPLLVQERAAPDAGLNHWKRLCEDLATHLDVLSKIELARRQAPKAPSDLGSMVDRVARQEETHVRRLRDLIARADPHALE